MPVYKYTLDKDIVITLSNKKFNALTDSNTDIFFKDRLMGNVSIEKYNNTRINITIYKGYSWDGCTPKIKVNNNVIGTWDGFVHAKTLLPKAYVGSLAHDFLLQFKSQHNISNNLCHFIMLELFKRDTFELRHIYFIMVHFWFWIKSGYYLIFR